MICPLCKQEKENVGPKIIGKEYVNEEKFNNETLIVKNVVMCNECLEMLKKGNIIVRENEQK